LTVWTVHTDVDVKEETPHAPLVVLRPLPVGLSEPISIFPSL
jgi:hypothetical protein